jgi:hypothetical protein
MEPQRRPRHPPLAPIPEGRPANRVCKSELGSIGTRTLVQPVMNPSPFQGSILPGRHSQANPLGAMVRIRPGLSQSGGIPPQPNPMFPSVVRPPIWKQRVGWAAPPTRRVVDIPARSRWARARAILPPGGPPGRGGCNWTGHPHPPAVRKPSRARPSDGLPRFCICSFDGPD